MPVVSCPPSLAHCGWTEGARDCQPVRCAMYLPQAIPRVQLSLVIDYTAAVGVEVGRAGVAGAGTNLGELSAAVVEELIVDCRVRAELFLDHRARWSIEDAGRVSARCAVAQVAAESG